MLVAESVWHPSVMGTYLRDGRPRLAAPHGPGHQREARSFRADARGYAVKY